MNDLMSFGIHRLWKRFAINMSGVRRGQHVLDIAGGTGDLAKYLAVKLARRVMWYFQTLTNLCSMLAVIV